VHSSYKQASSVVSASIALRQQPIYYDRGLTRKRDELTKFDGKDELQACSERSAPAGCDDRLIHRIHCNRGNFRSFVLLLGPRH